MSKDEAWQPGAKKPAGTSTEDAHPTKSGTESGRSDSLPIGSVVVGEGPEPSVGSRNIRVHPPDGHSGSIQLNIQGQAESQTERQIQGQLQLMAQLQAQAQAQWQELHQFMVQLVAQIQAQAQIQHQDQWQGQLQAQLQFQLQLLLLLLLDQKNDGDRHKLLRELQELIPKKA